MRQGQEETGEKALGAYEKVKVFEKDVELYRERLQHDPDDAEAHYSLGYIYGRLGFLPKALPHYQRTVEINPGHIRAHNNIGNIYLRLNMFEPAIEAYDKVLALDPEYASGLAHMGQAHLAQKQFSRAVEYFERALEQEPRREVHLGLAEAYRQTGEVAKSEKHRKLAEAPPQEKDGD